MQSKHKIEKKKLNFKKSHQGYGLHPSINSGTPSRFLHKFCSKVSGFFEITRHAYIKTYMMKILSKLYIIIIYIVMYDILNDMILILTVTPIKIPVTKMRKVCPSNLNRGEELNSCTKVTFNLGSFSLIKTDYNTIWKQF